MFEDHWYQHSTPTPAPAVEPPKLRRQESLKNQNQSPRNSLERTSEVPQLKSSDAKRRHYPDPPKACIPRRPKSSSDLSALVHDDFVLPGAAVETAVNGSGYLELPKRPKSRNDLEDERLARYGVGRGVKRKGRKGKGGGYDVWGIKDELDFADWYGEFEDELEDANNDEYRLLHATLVSHLNTCNHLLATTDSTLSLLSELQTSFQAVDSQTYAFQLKVSMRE
ncbi:Golgi transport complex subunit 3 [Rhizina undulata]